MGDLATQQIENELQNATGQAGARAGPSKPRVSSGKLVMPSRPQTRPVMPAVRAKKTGEGKTLRRIGRGPSRDRFDQLSSPEKGSRKPKIKAIPNGTISPRRDDARTVVSQPLPTERPEVADSAPALTALNAQKSPHRSPGRKRTGGPAHTEEEPPEEARRAQCSPVADKSSQALANAVESNMGAGPGSNELESQADRQSAKDLEAASEKTAATRRKTRNTRSSKPVASSAREPASGGVDRTSPQVVITYAERTQASKRAIERPVNRKRPVDPQQSIAGDEIDLAGPNNDEIHQTFEQPRKRRAVTPEATVQSVETMERIDLGQYHELYGQQSLLRQAYKTLGDIGWSHREGIKYSKSVVDLDDAQVISLKNLCREAKSKMSELKAVPDDLEMASDAPEELARICEEVRALETTQAYFVNEDKVNNIYFHLFANLTKLVRHAVDCYGEMDKEDGELTPQRSITIHHLGVVASLLRAITSLYDTVCKKYCSPTEGLNVKQPVKEIVAALRPVQDRFIREIRRHQEREQEKLEHAARAEADRTIEERLEREDALAKQRAEIREQWMRLHDERWHVEPSLRPRWKIAHLRVPDLEPDTDGNGEPFERLEVFAPRFGPSLASTEKARQIDWTAIEIDALRTGLEEFAGDRLWVKIFRRYCRRDGPLNRFNVTEIVSIAADMVQYEEDKQRRYGEVEEWVRIAKRYMWTKPKLQGSGQENYVDDD